MIEEKFKLTGGFRVVRHVAEGTEVEASWAGEWKGSGPLAGVEGTDMGTGSGIQRIDGVLNPLWGCGVFTTKDGQMISYSFSGISVPAGPGQYRVRNFYLFKATSPKFEWLKSACMVWEEDDDLDKQEGYAKGYEWK